MKALVTGGSGFIGSTLIEKLLEQGIEVRALMRKTSSDANFRGLKVEKAIGDITDPASLAEAVQGVDLIFHLAGAISALDEAGFNHFNAEGTKNVAEAAAKHAPGLKRFVYLSSLAAGGPAGPEARKEADPDSPVSAYGRSKRGGEEELLKFRDQFEVVILRPPLVYGPRDTATLVLIKTVAKRFVPLLRAKTADGQKRYSYIHAVDLCDAIVRAGTVDSAKLASGEKFYVSSGEMGYGEFMDVIADGLGVKAFRFFLPVPILRAVAWSASRLSRMTGKAFVLSEDKLNEMLPDRWTCSNEKARELLGFSPARPLRESMKEAIDWYKRNQWI